MNIAFVHPNYPGSEGTGATHSATQVVRGLEKRGHNVCVYCTGKTPSEIQEEENRIELLSDVPIYKDFGKELNNAIRSRFDEFSEYDLVHSYIPKAMPSIGELKTRTGTSTVMTLNAYNGVCPKNTLLYKGRDRCKSNGYIKCSKCLSEHNFREASYYDDSSIKKIVGLPYKFITSAFDMKRIFDGLEYKNRIDAYRAPSMHVLQNYEHFGFDSDKIYVIPHPIDNRFDISHESEFIEPFELLFVGQLEYHKGVDQLVPIMERLSNETTKEFTLKIIGTGRLKNKIKSQIRSSSIGSNIELLGFVDYEDLPQIYSNSDLFVYPGRWDEPFARVFLEAIASGTPIATAEFGDISNMLGKACSTTKGTVESISKMIKDIVENDKLEKMSRAASRQTNRYQINSILDDVEEMYYSLE